MARETTKWPSTRWPITKIMSSDGCNGNRVPLEMGPWYDFREFGCHLGNVGLIESRRTIERWRSSNNNLLSCYWTQLWQVTLVHRTSTLSAGCAPEGTCSALQPRPAAVVRERDTH